VNKSKFDLCSDSVTLDYEALLHVSRIAMRYSLCALGDRVHRWYDPEPKLTTLDADRLIDDATSLAEATRAYHYLREGLTRDVVIMYRPEKGAEVGRR
jgi:hypothetical protein